MRPTSLRRRSLPTSRQAGLPQACREEGSIRLRFWEGWKAMAGAVVVVVGPRVMVAAAVVVARGGAAWKGPVWWMD